MCQAPCFFKGFALCSAADPAKQAAGLPASVAGTRIQTVGLRRVSWLEAMPADTRWRRIAHRVRAKQRAAAAGGHALLHDCSILTLATTRPAPRRRRWTCGGESTSLRTASWPEAGAEVRCARGGASRLDNAHLSRTGLRKESTRERRVEEGREPGPSLQNAERGVARPAWCTYDSGSGCWASSKSAARRGDMHILCTLASR